jgi:hypothetical protein
MGNILSLSPEKYKTVYKFVSINDISNKFINRKIDDKTLEILKQHPICINILTFSGDFHNKDKYFLADRNISQYIDNEKHYLMLELKNDFPVKLGLTREQYDVLLSVK